MAHGAPPDPALDRAIHALAGALERTGVVALSDRLTLAWSLTPHAELALDMAQVTSMDDAAVRALRIAAREIEGAGGRLRVVHPSAPAARALGVAPGGEAPAAGA